MKKIILAAVLLMSFVAPSFAAWTSSVELKSEVQDRYGVTKQVVYAITLTSDGSAGTYSFSNVMMQKISGLYLYALKFEIPTANPPGGAFTFDVKDEDGFLWVDLNTVATSDSAYSGDDTHGFFPPVWRTKSGVWSLAIGDIGDANDNFTVYLIFVK